MSFLASGEIDRVWIIYQRDWEHFEILGVFTTHEAAEAFRHHLEARNPKGKAQGLYQNEEWELDVEEPC